jgi:hypothetical protein
LRDLDLPVAAEFLDGREGLELGEGMRSIGSERIIEEEYVVADPAF